MRQSQLLGYIYGAAGAALFSTKAIFIKLAFAERVDAPLLLALRMIFSLPFFVGVGVYAWIRMRRETGRRPGAAIVLKAAFTGFIGYYLSSILDFEGLVYITAQLERLVLFTYPIFVLLLGWLFFGGRITLMNIAAAAVTYAGLMLVFLKALPEGGTNVIIGTALVLACALTFALYQLLAKGFITALGSALFTAIALSSSAMACVVHYIVVSRSLDFSASPRFMGLAAGTAVVATVIPSFLVNAGLSRISAQATSMIGTISPIITIGLAVWILNEPFTWVDAMGSALVIAGIGLFAVTERRPAAGPLPHAGEEGTHRAAVGR